MYEEYVLIPPLNVLDYVATKLEIRRYQLGVARAITPKTESGQPLPSLTCNLPGYSYDLGPMEFFVRDYPENCVPAQIKAAYERGLLVKTGKTALKGQIVILICRLDLTKVSTRFTCPTCSKVFPTTKANLFEDDNLIYCPACIKIMRDEDDDSEDIDFSSAEIDIDENKIRKS